MIDISLNNDTFKWNNKRRDYAYIVENIDRFFIIGYFANCIKFQSSIMPCARSDHFPICDEFIEPSKQIKNSFKCEKMWFQDPKFTELIRTWWTQASFEGSKMFIFISKLKLVKENILR